MSKKKIKRLITLGIGNAILLVIGTIYSVLFNDSRFVKNMDMRNYDFRLKDIPMQIIGILIIMYVLYLVFSIVKANHLQPQKEEQRTRKLSPKLGYFGFCGFFGFVGFWSYSELHMIYPFAFFIFFGFFGFFYEGKLSDTLEDEMFIENRRKAEIKAYKIGFQLLFITVIVVGMGLLSSNLEWCAIFMLISISIICALVGFLSNYLVYAYEKKE